MNYNSVSVRIYNALVADINAGVLVGGTQFSMGGTVIAVESKDGIGKLIEEWLGRWAVQRSLPISPNVGGQEFPDFYISPNNALLEIKAFDMDASANFDIANFESYCESLSNNPHRLYADYLIFGYRLNGTELRITNVWLKKIWEITCPSERFPLKVQVKRDVIYNIRPAAWYSGRARFQAFNNPELFVNALYNTQKIYLGTTVSAEENRYRTAILQSM